MMSELWWMKMETSSKTSALKCKTHALTLESWDTLGLQLTSTKPCRLPLTSCQLWVVAAFLMEQMPILLIPWEVFRLWMAVWRVPLLFGLTLFFGSMVWTRSCWKHGSWHSWITSPKMTWATRSTTTWTSLWTPNEPVMMSWAERCRQTFLCSPWHSIWCPFFVLSSLEKLPVGRRAEDCLVLWSSFLCSLESLRAMEQQCYLESPLPCSGRKIIKYFSMCYFHPFSMSFFGGLCHSGFFKLTCNTLPSFWGAPANLAIHPGGHWNWRCLCDMWGFWWDWWILEHSWSHWESSATRWSFYHLDKDHVLGSIPPWRYQCVPVGAVLLLLCLHFRFLHMAAALDGLLCHALPRCSSSKCQPFGSVPMLRGTSWVYASSKGRQKWRTSKVSTWRSLGRDDSFSHKPRHWHCSHRTLLLRCCRCICLAGHQRTRNRLWHHGSDAWQELPARFLQHGLGWLKQVVGRTC